MRFNIEDLRKGNISKERFDEVVLSIRLKIDESKQKSTDIFRKGSALLSSLEKEILFKSEQLQKGENAEKYLHDENLSKITFATKIMRTNIKLLEMEAMIDFFRQEEQRENLVSRILELEEKSKAHQLDSQASANLIALKSELIRLLLAEREQLLNQLYENINYRNNLIRSMNELNKVVLASRKIHSENIAKALNNAEIDGKRVFENLTPEQRKQFSERIIQIEEKTNFELMKINQEIEKERALLVQQRQASGKSDVLFGAQSKLLTNAKIQNLEKKRDQILKNRKNEYKEEFEKLNIKVPPEKLDTAIEEVVSEPAIKKEIKEHNDVSGKALLQNEQIKEEILNQNVIIHEIRSDLGENKEQIKKVESKENPEVKFDEGITFSLENIDLDNIGQTISLDGIDLDQIDVGSIDLNDLDVENMEVEAMKNESQNRKGASL